MADNSPSTETHLVQNLKPNMLVCTVVLVRERFVCDFGL
jgi:hypothetical protein